ncbi:MAG: glycosyltransferase family 1 protein [Deltaproteobacteria bacterium]|nr:glycosyltransferase family 1 protein [Deltaproteobacteria bacterium]
MIGHHRNPVRVLYLEANGVGSRIIWVDTVLRGILGYQNGALPPRPLRRYPKINLLFGELADFNARLSYVADWRDAFQASPGLKVELCNINNLVHYSHCLLRMRQYDLIVVSHVAAGDDMTVLTKSRAWFDRRRCPLVVFLGNEYDLLDDKIEFVRQTDAEYLCTQLPVSAARHLYGDLARTRIVEMPHALNPNSYYSIDGVRRSTDIGFVGDMYWPFVGDRERTDLIEWFETHGAAAGLGCDIRKQRLAREEWNLFLNQCHAVIGAESGTYYLNGRGKLLDCARAYNLRENQAASFDEIFDRFYSGVAREVSGKSISSRHFEPIGTKTCQILLEGEYNGILQPNLHYIAVKKDLSNVEEAIARFRDESYRSRIVEETYDYVLSEHTYVHRVERLLNLVLDSGQKAAPHPAPTQIAA